MTGGQVLSPDMAYRLTPDLIWPATVGPALLVKLYIQSV
jgi:hypothetical protein